VVVTVDGDDVRLEGRGREREVEDCIVNTGEVARAGRLEVLRLEGKRIDVDARRGGARVVLVGLDEVEVAALTLRETVLAVELDLGDRRGVAELGIRVAPRAVEAGVAINVAGVLDNPDDLLARVVEGELDLVGRGGNRLRARELELLDQVLVGDLREAAALLRVEVDVIDIERARDQALATDGAEDLRGLRGRRCGGANVAQVLEVLELDVDLDLVVLEGDEGKREARVAVEPELERDVEGLLRDAARDLAVAVAVDDRARAEGAVITTGNERGVRAGQDRGIADIGLRDAGAAGRRADIEENTAVAIDHVEVGQLLARGERELIPDVEPLTIVLVDLLAANLNIDVVDQVLAEVGHPGEGVGVSDKGLVDRGEGHLDIDTGNQIAVTGDRALDTLAKVADTVEGLLDRLHREVRMAAVKLLEKGNLRVGRQIHVLGAIGDELH